MGLDRKAGHYGAETWLPLSRTKHEYLASPTRA